MEYCRIFRNAKRLLPIAGIRIPRPIFYQTPNTSIGIAGFGDGRMLALCDFE